MEPLFFAKDNGIDAPKVFPEQKNLDVPFPTLIWLIIVELNGTPTELASILHGTTDSCVEMFTSEEKAKVFWNAVSSKFDSESQQKVKFVAFKKLDEDLLPLYLAALKDLKQQYRLDPFLLGLDECGREMWRWSVCEES